MGNTVSVVIPVRDRFEYLERAILSVLSQTVPPSEIIVVDDGSIEPVANALSKFGSHVNVIRYEKGMNANFARNKGLDECVSDYVAFLDSDDWWGEEHLETAIKVLSNSSYSGIFGAYCAFSLGGVESDLIIRPRIPLRDNESPSSYLFLRGGNVRTSTFVLETQFARQVRFDDQLFKHQDWDFMVRAQFQGRLGFNPRPQVYIDHQASGRMTGSTDLGATKRFASKNKPILTESEYVGFLLRTAKHSLEISDCMAAREILTWIDGKMTFDQRVLGIILRVLAVHRALPLACIAAYKAWRGISVTFRSSKFCGV